MAVRALDTLVGDAQRRGVNLTKLESRPIPGSPWQYRFYVDVEGHVAAERVSAALAAIREQAADVRVLGTYPRSA